jgi:hypothetical protein
VSVERQRRSYAGARGASRAGSVQRGIAEANPVSQAVVIARLFQDLRRNLGLSDHQIAIHLRTSRGVIRALELGAYNELPPWPETCRVVSAYAAMAGIDPRPVLHALGQEFANREAANGEEYVQPSWLALVATAFERAKAIAEAAVAVFGHAGRGARQKPRPTALILAVMAVSALLTGLVAGTTMPQAAAGALSSPVRSLVKGAHNYMLMYLAPARDGLRWIEVDDPRSRRADKLRPSKS